MADDDKEPENLPQIQTAEDAEISLPKPEADAIQTEETKQLEGVTADADAVGMEVQGAQKEVIPDRVEEDQKPSYGASEGDIRSAIPDDVMYLRIQSEVRLGPNLQGVRGCPQLGVICKSPPISGHRPNLTVHIHISRDLITID